MTQQLRNNLSTPAPKPKFQAFIKNDAVMRNISSTIGDQTKTNRFVASIISAVSINPALQECEAPTIISAALLGEALNLSPSPQLGHYYMVPFNDKKNGVKNATFQLGYKGYLQLAIRSGQYKNINVTEIKQGELISYNPLTEELKVSMIDDEFERESLPTVGYYARFELINGFTKAMYWNQRKMLAHADKYSSAFSAVTYQKILDGQIAQNELWKYSSFWYKDFDGMGFKTMLRQLISKWGIMSIELQMAFANDMTFKEDLNSDKVNYFDAETSKETQAPPTQEVQQRQQVNINQITGEVIEPTNDQVQQRPSLL